MIKLKIALQKSGRLLDGSLDVLKECGIKIKSGNGLLKADAANFPMEVLFLRNSDIPEYVQDGVADIAIVGDNLLKEHPCQVETILPLGFSRCKLSLAVPKNSSINSAEDFQGKKIATSYPNTLRNYLESKGVSADIHTISGSVEIAPAIGLAEGICDIVSSGNTLFMNGLKEIEVMMHSEAVLIVNPNLSPEKKALVDKLVFRIKAVLAAKTSKYILLNIANDKIEKVTAILPGMKSPTILPLAKEGWSSIHSVISEEEFWDNIDALKEAGAEGILVIPIQKMVL
jgi:ATP phosphoribosyltransferase